MAVLDAYSGEAPNSPELEWSEGKYTITRYIKTVHDSVLDDMFVALNWDGMPQPYDPYENYPLAVVKKVSAKRHMENAAVWVTTVKYETPNDDTKQREDPKLDLPTVRVSFENYQVAATDLNDPDDSTITSSAGEPFDPTPSKDDARMLITIKQNEDAYADDHPELGRQYQNRINSDVFWGFPPHCVKCQNINADGVKLRNLPNGTTIFYLEVEYVFSCKADQWDLSLLDQGTWYFAGGAQKVFQTAEGVPVVGLLDGLGGRSPGNPATAHFLAPTQIYEALPFAALGLPQSFSECIPIG